MHVCVCVCVGGGGGVCVSLSMCAGVAVLYITKCVHTRCASVALLWVEGSYIPSPISPFCLFCST